MPQFDSLISNKIVPFDFLVDPDYPIYVWVGEPPHQHEEQVIPIEDNRFFLLAASTIPKNKRYLVPKYTEAQKKKLFTVAVQNSNQNARNLAATYGMLVDDIPQPIIQIFDIGMLIYNVTSGEIEQYLYDNNWLYYSTIRQFGK